VIEAALRAVLEKRSFVLTQLQPEGSVAFGRIGTGWSGVYRWCAQAVARGGGQLSGDALVFGFYDLLILHLDADVAESSYAEGGIEPLPSDGALPCHMPCPPASDTTDALRAVMLSWFREAAVPPRTVVCMPSKSTEAWVVAALFPRDRAMKDGIECHRDPESRLSQQPKAQRLRKAVRDYQDHAADIETSWSRLASPRGLGEAARFELELRAAMKDV
jgi:hypothetical protein